MGVLSVGDLIGSNVKGEISLIITSDVICSIDVPLIITRLLVIDRHTRHSKDSTSDEHECNTLVGICEYN